MTARRRSPILARVGLGLLGSLAGAAGLAYLLEPQLHFRRS